MPLLRSLSFAGLVLALVLRSFSVAGQVHPTPPTTDVPWTNPLTVTGVRSPGAVNVQAWGAKGDGTTPDGAAINAATAYVGNLGGGTVYLPPTGAAYVIDHGITVPAGVHLQGAGGLNWTSPIDNTESHWTNKSTWLHCTDTANPCIDITGSSVTVEGLNFWYTQPTPTSGNCASPCTYVPFTFNTYPWTIKIEPTAMVGIWINSNSIVNASHCVDWEGPQNGVFGIYSGMDQDNFGCFVTGIRFYRIDNTLNLSRLRHEMWWYQGTANVWYAMQSSAVGHVDWDIQYLANPQITDVEFAFTGTAMKFTDAGPVGGFNATFAVNHMQAKGVSFNEVCQAMAVASPTTTVSGTFTDTLLFSDSTTSGVAGQCAQKTPYMINLASDNAVVFFNGLVGGLVQSIATIGGGNSGQLHLTNLHVDQYSSFAPGAVGVQTQSGSFVEFIGSPLVYPNPTTGMTAGALCSGTGGCTHANSMISGLELAAIPGSVSQLTFTNMKSPQSPGYYLGTPVWDLRNDTSGTFYLDRSSVTSGFIDTPISITPTGTASGQSQVGINGQAVFSKGVNGTLEVGAAAGAASQVMFSKITTPLTAGSVMGTLTWGWVTGVDGNIYLDRYNPSSGAYIDPPLYVIPLSTGVNQTQVQITGEAVIHGGSYMVPILISALPACSGSNAGLLQVVSNGAAAPAPPASLYGTTVGTTGNLAALVMCNNTNWIYQ
jgi:hypothetical protein